MERQPRNGRVLRVGAIWEFDEQVDEEDVDW